MPALSHSTQAGIALPPSEECAVCVSCGGGLEPYLKRVRDAVTGAEFTLLKCRGCGLGVTAAPPNELQPFYAEYHRGRHGATALFCARRRLRWASQVSRAGRRLLDVGCGDGTFLALAERAGWQVAGTEMNLTAARGAGLDVRAEVAEWRGATRFDCVTLWHSLEHMRDPRRTLETVRALLADDGVVLIAVPDNGGWQARLFGERWFHLDVPRHLFHFDKRSLETLLRSAGLQPIRRWRQEFEYDLMGWVQSALNAVFATRNVFFDLARGRATRADWAERAGNWIGGAVLAAIALPLVAASAMAFRGGTLIVAARPAQRQAC